MTILLGGWEQQVPPLRFAPVGMTILCGGWEQQVPPLRFAPVGMTILCGWMGTAGPSTALRSGRDDNSVRGDGNRSPFDFAQARLSTALPRISCSEQWVR